MHVPACTRASIGSGLVGTVAGSPGAAVADDLPGSLRALALPPVFFLVDANLRFRYVSEAADQYLKVGVFLSLSNGHLVFQDPVLKKELLPAVRSACEMDMKSVETPESRLWIDWRAPGSEVIHLIRVTSMHLPSSEPGRSESLAGIFVHAPSVDPVESYAVRHRLSRTERRLLALLLAGHDLKSAALQLGQKINTTRTVLKSVFLKTATHRQSELIRNVLRDQ